MKSTSEAINIRQHVLQNFEDALVASEEDRRRLMNVVIVGGGPTGVELSGAFAEMKRHVFPRDYPELDFKRMNVILMEGSDKTLGNMSSQSSAKSKQYLEELGVTVMLNTRVKDYDGQQVLLEDGNVVPSNTVIWAAGIRGNAIDGMPVDAITRGNRFLVDRFSLVKECANIYAIGDIAFMVTEKYPQSHPQVANVALGQAAVLAKNFRHALQSKPWQPYEYKDKGSMATVGKHKAVVDLGFGHFRILCLVCLDGIAPAATDGYEE